MRSRERYAVAPMRSQYFGEMHLRSRFSRKNPVNSSDRSPSRREGDRLGKRCVHRTVLELDESGPGVGIGLVLVSRLLGEDLDR